MMRVLFTLAILLSISALADKHLREVTVMESQLAETFQNAEFDPNSGFPVIKDGEMEKEEVDEVELANPYGPPRKPKACWKDATPRGRGKLPDRATKQCPENQEKNMGFCYPRCGDKQVGLGPFCVDDCKATPYHATAPIFCCESEELCIALMEEVSSTLPKAVAALARDLINNPDDVQKIARDFRAILASSMKLRLPMCSNLPQITLYMREEDVERDAILKEYVEDMIEPAQEQMQELDEEAQEEGAVSATEILSDFAQETLDAQPNPILAVN